ncbi:MAG: hypothetical protein H6862_00500 [Rhodospirillales bacterium]|nr:hypothetical protein [Rhodospirillales bacterium]
MKIEIASFDHEKFFRAKEPGGGCTFLFRELSCLPEFENGAFTVLRDDEYVVRASVQPSQSGPLVFESVVYEGPPSRCKSFFSESFREGDEADLSSPLKPDALFHFLREEFMRRNNQSRQGCGQLERLSGGGDWKLLRPSPRVFVFG